MKTAVMYLRYSSERQTEQSIEGQLRVCNDYAERNNILVVDTYTDRAMTGTNDNRSGFQRLMKDSHKKAWDIVLVYKLDRFSRNKYEMAIHRKTLRDNGIKLVSAMENIPDSPEGIILESLLEGMAEYYSVELSQKIKRGLNESRQKGNHTGGRKMFGYRFESNKKVAIDEPEAEVVRTIFQQYASNVIVKDIIASLTEKGIVHNGRPFVPNTVYGILANEKYVGVYRHGDEVFTNIFPQIVPTPIFEAVKKKIDDNRFGKRSVEVVYMLRHKIFCGYCGRSVFAESGTSQNGEVKRYYKCSGRKRGFKCKKSTVPKEALEKLIIETTYQVLDKPDTINSVADKIMDAHKKRLQDQSVLNLLIKEQGEIRKSLNNLVAAIEKGMATNTTKRRLDELEAAYEDICGKIAIEKTKLTILITKDEIVNYIKAALKQDPEQMLELLIRRIILFDDRIEIVYNYTDASNPDDSRRDLIFYVGSTYVGFAPPTTRPRPKARSYSYFFFFLSYFLFAFFFAFYIDAILA